MAGGRDARAIRRPKPHGARRTGRVPQGSPGLGRSYPEYGASGVGVRQRWIEGPLPKGRPGNSTGVHAEQAYKHRARDVRTNRHSRKTTLVLFFYSHETVEDRQVLGVPRAPLLFTRLGFTPFAKKSGEADDDPATAIAR